MHLKNSKVIIIKIGSSLLVDNNKKVRKIRLAQTMSKKNSDKKLYILEDVKKEVKKTKEFNKFLLSNNLENALIISDKGSLKNINKSARNIKNVKLIENTI